MCENKSEVASLNKESQAAESDQEKGEKLYVTADKRGESGGCKRPLCWTLLGLVVIAIVALIVLAATGLLFTSTPNTLEQYNASLSSARAFGGLVHDQANHDHNHDHEHHDHDDHDHSQNNEQDNDIHELLTLDPDSSTKLPHTTDMSVDLNPDDESGDIYVPRTLEGEFRIDNKEFVSAFEDPDSDEYREFTKNFKEALKNSIFDRNSMETGDNDITVEIVQIRNGSVIVTYRIHWSPNHDDKNAGSFLTAASLREKLDEYLDKNNRMISVYHIADEKTVTKAVLNLCKINNNDCEYRCEFDESTLDFSCICPRGQIEDMRLPKHCTSLLNDYENGKKTSESVAIANESGRSGFNQNDYEENLPETDPKAPEPGPEPTTVANLETKLEPKPEPEPMPKSDPQPEPEPIPISEPEPEPEPIPTPGTNLDPGVIPIPEPTSEPEPVPTSEPNPENEPISTPEPNPEPESTSEPIPAPEPAMTSTSTPVPIFEHSPTEKIPSELEHFLLPSLTEQKPKNRSLEQTPEVMSPLKPDEDLSTELQSNETNGPLFIQLSQSEPGHEVTESSTSENKLEQAKSYKTKYDSMTPPMDSIIEPEIEFKPFDSETTTVEMDLPGTELPTNESDENNTSKSKSNSEQIFNIDHIIDEEYTTEPTLDKNTETNNNAFNQINDKHFSIKEVLPGKLNETDSSKTSTETSVSKDNTMTVDKSESTTQQTPDEYDWLQGDAKETYISVLINKAKLINEDSKINENSQEKDKRVSKSFNTFEDDVTTQTTRTVKNAEDGEITLDYVRKLYETSNPSIKTESKVEKTITGVTDSTLDPDFEDYKKQIMNTEEAERHYVVNETHFFINEQEAATSTSTESSKFKFISTYQPDTVENHTPNIVNIESPIFDETKHETSTEYVREHIPYNQESNPSASMQEKIELLNMNSTDSSTEKNSIHTNKTTDDSWIDSTSYDVMKHATVMPDIDSDWLSEAVTEISYESLHNKQNKDTTQTSINHDQEEIMRSGIKHDFEPDYLNAYESKSGKELNHEEPNLEMANDYENDESRIKKESNVHVHDVPVSLNQETKPSTEYETTTVLDYIYNQANNNQSQEKTVSTVPEAKIYAKPELKTEDSSELHNTLFGFTSMSNNSSQENINEVSSNNNTHSIGKKLVHHHSTEYDDHDTEMNPFLPDVENNKVLVTKLQEGNDIVEPTNLNETQNENVDEHNSNKTTNLNSNSRNDMNETLQENRNTSELFKVWSNSQEETLAHTTKSIFNDRTDRNPGNSFEQTTDSREDNTDFDDNRENSQTPTFLLDTDDLDSSAPKRHNFNSLNYNDNDSLKVVPIEEESPYSKENVPSINDISDSRKKSERRTTGLSNSEFVTNNEA